jgi:hypothetical protein
LRIDPESYRRSMEGPPSRSSPRVTDLAEWREARRAALGLERWCVGTTWLVRARAGLVREGQSVVRVDVRWKPYEPLTTVLSVHFNGVPVVVRGPSGDLDMRDVVRPKRGAK